MVSNISKLEIMSTQFTLNKKCMVMILNYYAYYKWRIYNDN